MRLDQEGSNDGHVVVDRPGLEVVVGLPYHLTVTYVAGPRGVDVGGCLRFRLPGFRVDKFRGRVPVACSNPAVSLTCTNAVPTRNGKTGSEFFTLDYLFVTIVGHSLSEGDTVSVAYGDSVVPQIVAPRLAFP